MTELSITAQHWVAVVLIWVGLGSLAGLLARIVLPVREPSGPLPTLTLGITGTAVGLGVLSWVLRGNHFNPISPLGFLASTAAALVLLVVYNVVRLGAKRKEGDKRKVGHGPHVSRRGPRAPMRRQGIRD